MPICKSVILGELGKQIVTLAGYSVDLCLPEPGVFTGLGGSLSEIGEDSLEPADLGVSELVLALVLDHETKSVLPALGAALR
jgi:hypothetical protein